MKHISIAALLLFTSSAYADQFTDNAIDVPCEWSDSKGHTGSETCHITQQGTHMGEDHMIFHIGNRKHEYWISEPIKKAQLVLNDKTLWTGTWDAVFTNLNKEGTSFIETIKISDGITVKMYFRYGG